MCTVLLREVVSHYFEGNSNMYCCLLNASKAFNRIQYGNLFSILLSKNIHPLVLRLLVNIYLHKKTRVSWGNHLSQYFTLANGVKQGGVLSPILFTCYIDNLLIKLEESGYRCHIRHIVIGALSYADDITLLSPNLRGLNVMLHICSLYADNFDITFNSKKTVCIEFGEQTRQYETIKLNNKTITWVDSIKHLGNYFDTTMSDKIDCQSKISAFIWSVKKFKVNFVIYKEMFYLLFSNRTVVHIMIVKCGNLIH